MLSYESISFSVSDYLDFINLALKPTERVTVIGEVSSLKNHQTGVYLSIKDPNQEALLDVYIDPYTYKKIQLPLDEGMLIKLHGVAKIFKRRGSFRFHATNIELAGEGSLKKAYELLKSKLTSEALFERKRNLPELIENIVVITSSSGAVLADFKNNLIPQGIKVTVLDTRVEGRDSKSQILDALKYVNNHANNYDACVLIRGGGSLEDLQVFNTEEVTRAVYNNQIPVIAGIGHDKDVPLACLSADYSCSTPTATALLLNENRVKIERTILQTYQKIQEKIEKRIELTNYRIWESEKNIFKLENNLRRTVEKISQKLNFYINSLEYKLQKTFSSINLLCLQINRSITDSVKERNNKINSISTLIDSYNPEKMLKRGYALAYSKNGKIIKSSNQLDIGEKLTLKFKQGTAKVNVESTQI